MFISRNSPHQQRVPVGGWESRLRCVLVHNFLRKLCTGPFPSRKTDCLPDLLVLPGYWSQWFRRELCRPIHNCSSKWWYWRIRFEMWWNFMINDENPIWWHLWRIVQIKNTSLWETQDRTRIVWPGDSSEEVRTWLSQIENYGEKKYRARNSE